MVLIWAQEKPDFNKHDVLLLDRNSCLSARMKIL